MVAVWRNAASFDPARAGASTWIFAIARNRRIDQLRRAGRPSPDPADPLFRPDPSPDGFAALSAHPPACFEEGHPNVTRMFPDYLEIEQRYVKDTGIFPIMHAVAIRRETL